MCLLDQSSVLLLTGKKEVYFSVKSDLCMSKVLVAFPFKEARPPFAKFSAPRTVSPFMFKIKISSDIQDQTWATSGALPTIGPLEFIAKM